MASARVPRVHSCGNLHHFLVRGALGPSPSHRGGLQAPFLFDLRVAGMADSTIQRAWTPPVSQHLVTRSFPVQIRPRSWRRPPRLPLHHATALQPWRQAAGEDSAVRLRGDTWPRRSARPMISLRGFRLGGMMEGYTLWAVATSAGTPILYGRFRPWSGAQPTGTYRFIATRLLRSQRHSNVCCCDRGLGSWRCPSHLPLGEAQAPQARGMPELHRPVEYSTVADAVSETPRSDS